jgi:hypothetical protein
VVDVKRHVQLCFAGQITSAACCLISLPYTSTGEFPFSARIEALALRSDTAKPSWVKFATLVPHGVVRTRGTPSLDLSVPLIQIRLGILCFRSQKSIAASVVPNSIAISPVLRCLRTYSSMSQARSLKGCGLRQWAPLRNCPFSLRIPYFSVIP